MNNELIGAEPALCSVHQEVICGGVGQGLVFHLLAQFLGVLCVIVFVDGIPKRARKNIVVVPKRRVARLRRCRQCYRRFRKFLSQLTSPEGGMFLLFRIGLEVVEWLSQLLTCSMLATHTDAESVVAWTLWVIIANVVCSSVAVLTGLSQSKPKPSFIDAIVLIESAFDLAYLGLSLVAAVTVARTVKICGTPAIPSIKPFPNAVDVSGCTAPS